MIKKACTEGAKNIKIGGSLNTAVIAKSLQIKVLKSRASGVYRMTVWHKPDVGMLVHHTLTGKRYYIPSAIEFGHAFPGRGGGEASPKDVKPIPYIRSSFAASKHTADKMVAQTAKRKLIELVR